MFKGKNNPNYKHGRYYKHYCLDCHKRIDPRAKRCDKCFHKYNRGINHCNYKGEFPKCSDCGKQLSTRKNKDYIPKRCMKCWHKFAKGINGTNYNKTHKRKLNKYTLHRHHKNLNRNDNTKNNILILTCSNHRKLHAYAYNYLVKLNLIDKYIKWFNKYF
jgi:hypothetical protein